MVVRYFLGLVFVLAVTFLFNCSAHAESYFLSCPHDWELSVGGPLSPAACRHSDDGGTTYVSDVEILTLPELSDLVRAQLVSNNYMMDPGDFDVVLLSSIVVLFGAWAGIQLFRILR